MKKQKKKKYSKVNENCVILKWYITDQGVANKKFQIWWWCAESNKVIFYKFLASLQAPSVSVVFEIKDGSWSGDVLTGSYAKWKSFYRVSLGDFWMLPVSFILSIVRICIYKYKEIFLGANFRDC